MTSAEAIELAKVGVDAVRALAWPVLTGVILFCFRGPLRRVAEALATKFRQASKLSFASLTIEIEASARVTGDLELTATVETLSPGAVEHLLRTSRNGFVQLVSVGAYMYKHEYGLPLPEVLSALRELEDKGLLKFSSALGPYLATIQRLPRYDADRFNSDRMWYLASHSEGSSQDKEICSQRYSLTEKGRQAADAIVRAVAVQLAREAN